MSSAIILQVLQIGGPLQFFEAKLTSCCYRPIRAKFAKGHSKLYPFMKNDKQRLPNEYVIEKMYDL